MSSMLSVLLRNIELQRRRAMGHGAEAFVCCFLISFVLYSRGCLKNYIFEGLESGLYRGRYR
ncbi:hypothetical protein BD408DRAFT_422739 [Parasitella parasitica]|nr:hypothetical protein BD408DRAFT_422739 [Parasitella parasitica]